MDVSSESFGDGSTERNTAIDLGLAEADANLAPAGTFPIRRIGLNIVEDRRLAHEKSAVDPTDLVVGRFSRKLCTLPSPARSRTPNRPGAGTAVTVALRPLATEAHDLADIVLRDTIGLGRTSRIRLICPPVTRLGTKFDGWCASERQKRISHQEVQQSVPNNF
jgi:hypothetical protein